MSACENYINEVKINLPDKCSVEDLIEQGIFKSPQAAAHARRVGDTPDYFKLGRRIMYPKDGVIEWLNEKKHESRQTIDKIKTNRAVASLQEPSRMENCCRKALVL